MKVGAFNSLMGFVRRHENGILTIATGITTLYAVYRAIKDGPAILEKIDELSKRDDLTGTQKVGELAKVSWKVVGATTASLIFTGLHHKFAADAIGNLSSALTIAQIANDERKEHENKVVGEGTSEKVDESIAKSHAVSASPALLNDRIVTNTGHGSDLFYDDWTGRWFYSDINFIKARVNDLNYQLLNEMYISVSEYYQAIDMPEAGCGKEYGWNVDYGTLDLQFFAQLDEDDRSYTIIKFRNEPCARWDTRRRW